MLAQMAVRPSATVAATYGRRRRPQAAATADPCTAQTHTRHHIIGNSAFHRLCGSKKAYPACFLTCPRHPVWMTVCCFRSLPAQAYLVKSTPPFLAQYPRLGNFRRIFSGAWKNFREISCGALRAIQGPEKPPFSFPILGKKRREFPEAWKSGAQQAEAEVNRHRALRRFRHRHGGGLRMDRPPSRRLGLQALRIALNT